MQQCAQVECTRAQLAIILIDDGEVDRSGIVRTRTEREERPRMAGESALSTSGGSSDQLKICGPPAVTLMDFVS